MVSASSLLDFYSSFFSRGVVYEGFGEVVLVLLFGIGLSVLFE